MREAYYWMRQLRKGRTEVAWSDGECAIRVHGETDDVVEIVEAVRRTRNGGPHEPDIRRPRFGMAKPILPHPDQQAMDVG